MKKILFNNQEYEAEKIIKLDDNIIGQDLNGNELFAFRGISDFSSFKIENEDGVISDFLNLDSIKQDKIKELNKKCNEIIYTGFYSNADGTNKLYDFELENQINMMGLQSKAEKGETVSYYAKGEACHDYTPTQFLQLVQDGATFKFNTIEKYKKLKEYVSMLTTSDKVNAITFETEIPTT